MNSSLYDGRFYSSKTGLPTTLTVDSVWILVAAILAVIGGILVYFLFVKSKQEFKGFLAKLRNFCGFKHLFIEDILKIIYLISAIFVTLLSLGMIGTSFLGFITMLIFGNLMLRISSELVLTILSIHRNVVEINSKLKK